MSFLDSTGDPKKAGPKNNTKRPLQFFLLATLGVGAVASLFTAPALPTWYASLNRPTFAPPPWLFAPVWTTLYILMALAAWRVWKKTGLRAPEMAAFALQLALNLGWSVLFFGLHQIGAALMEIAVLDVAILATLVLFFRRDRLAAFLFLPCLVFSMFTTFLTYAFWRLN